MTIGTLIHLGLEEFFRTQSPGAAIRRVEASRRDILIEKAQNLSRDLDPWEIRTQLGVDVVRHWVEYVATVPGVLPLDEILHVEHRLELPIPGSSAVLSGKADLIGRIGNQIIIVDHKTLGLSVVSETELANYRRGLRVDQQLTAYAAIYREHYPGASGPIRVWINGIVRAVPVRPHRKSNGQLSTADSTLRRTTHQLFLEEALDGPWGADYDQALELLQTEPHWPRYFFEMRSVRTPDMMDAWKRSAFEEARRLERVLENPSLEAIPRGSFRTCGNCLYLDQCETNNLESFVSIRYAGDSI
jgi:hypothetical protein